MAGNTLEGIALAPTVLAMTEYFDCYIQEMARQPHLARQGWSSARDCKWQIWGQTGSNIEKSKPFLAFLDAPPP